MEAIISANDKRTADAFWILLKPLKREIRQILATKLDESLHGQDIQADKISMVEARQFVKSLSRHGEIKIPSDERGIYALLDEKYK